MRRILTSLMFVASVYSFAQVGVSKNATDTPRATLDVRAMGGATPDGVLIPNVSKSVAQSMPTPVNSTLVYITNSGAGGNRTGDVDADGFYYFKDTKWVKLGGGAASSMTTSGFYSEDGALAGNRVVNQNNHSLKFTTGTGALEVEGTSKLMGGSYVNVTKVETTSYTVVSSDYYITVDGPTDEVIITLPAPSESKGRVLIISNTTSQNVALKKLPDNTQALFGTDIASVAVNNAMWLVCDGEKWFNVIGF